MAFFRTLMSYLKKTNRSYYPSGYSVIYIGLYILSYIFQNINLLSENKLKKDLTRIIIMPKVFQVKRTINKGNKMKHTKGKWIASHISEFEIDIIDENGRTISTITNWNEQEANANLIASAPDMLEVLKKLIVARTEDIFDRMLLGNTKHLDIIQKVIARAEGGA